MYKKASSYDNTFNYNTDLIVGITFKQTKILVPLNEKNPL